MSSALVRQALEFVDPDLGGSKKKRGGKVKATVAGRVEKPKTKPKSDNRQEHTEFPDKSTQRVPQEVIDRLLKLSQPVVDKHTANRVAKRVVKGKPLVDKIKIKKEPQKSILFPEG